MEHNQNKIISFYQRQGRMPTYAELMKIYGFKSKNSVFKLVKKMVEENFLHKDDQGRLLPGRLFKEIRVLGMVEAGFPSPAEEELADTMSLDDYLVKNRESTFMLRVKGESMKDAGIMNGDMVLVERNTTAKDGQIVIAEVDGEWTIKYLRNSSKKPYLEPANKKFHNIYPENELKIAAVVKAVVRKY
ncbi:MAG: transcriptional repressor LexA [Candidatus Buchananbacteria bacterium]|jgi:repressor LexA